MNKFDISKYKVIFTLPERIEEPFSWIDHIPFAFFLVDVLRPGLLVELGVHSGNSYNAFCQAVKTVKSDTKCYGIDNWLGDKQSGYFDGSVYHDLSAYQQNKYKNFSYLLKMTFDEGLNYFSDNTIDLLHIDGLHTYKAVKHDFDSWLPKMSDKGVIVLHDTCVRENDFGVWKLWKEISRQYPSYEFTDGHGLGIVAVGKNTNNEFLAFLDNAEKNNYYQIIFANLGNKIVLIEQTKNLSKELSVKNKELNILTPVSTAQLYIDQGEGYSETNSLIKKINSNETRIEYDLHNFIDIKGLRFDPLNDYCQITIRNVSLIHGNNKLKKIKFKTNAWAENENVFDFDTNDPQIYLELDNISGIKKVIIELEYLSVGIDSVIQMMEKINLEINIKNQELKTIENAFSQKNDELQQKNAKIADNDRLIFQQKIKIKQHKELQKQKQELIVQLESEDGIKDELIQDRENTIQQHELSLQQRDNTIQEKESELQSKIEQINFLGQEIQKLNSAILEKDNQVKIQLSEIQSQTKYLNELKHSLSFRLAWVITAPARFIYNLFRKPFIYGSKRWLWLQFFITWVRSPIQILRNLNRRNIRILFKALKREPPTQIFNNIFKLLSKNNKITLYLRKKNILPIDEKNKEQNEINIIRESKLFNEDFYKKNNTDIINANMDPAFHYYYYGWKEGCDPGPNFSTNFYLENNPDVKQANINPLLHYIEFGRVEGRSISNDDFKLTKERQQKSNPLKNLIIYSHSILFISNDARIAGAEVLLLHLLKWFVEHTAYHLKIICLEGGVLLEKFQNLGPTIVWQDFIKQFPKKTDRQNALNKFCGQIDLVYGNTVVSPLIYNELNFLEVPIITHVHELEKSIRKYVDLSTVKKMHRYTNAYIGCSTPVTKNLIENHYADKKQIPTIYDFIDSCKEQTVSISKTKLRKKLHLNENSFIVFGCGTIYWRKGVDLFIETALKLLKKGITNFNFYWIGPQYWDAGQDKGEYPTWEELEKMMKSEGLNKYITFLGEKTNLREYFSAGDLFYLSSREDPFPLVSLEAAACSLPTICFADAGGMPEFVKNNAGYVVPYEDIDTVADKIVYLIDQPKVLQKLGKCAKEKMLARHTVDIAGPQILEYCRKVGNLKPLVSVMIPNYNYEKYLIKRLDSIFNQTFKDFEVIVLDDASTDNSLEIIDKVSHLPGVRVFKNKRNSGNVFKQWKKGLRLTNGEIIWIAEADDYCQPEFLEILLPKFADHEVVLAYANSYIVDNKNVINGDYTPYYNSLDPYHWNTSYIVSAEEEINYGLGVKNTIPNVSSVLFRKDLLINKITEETLNYILSGDWFTYIQVIKNNKIAFCVEKLNFHRKHKQTVTKKSHQENQKQIILDEAARIHEIVLRDFKIDFEYMNKWDRYITEQIHGLYFPNPKKEEYDSYYPYTNNKLKIEKKAIKRKKKSNKTAIIATHVADKTGAPLNILSVARHLFEVDDIRCITFALEGGVLLNEFKKYGEAWVISDNIIQGKNISVSKYLLNAQEVPSFALIQTACCGGILPELKKCNTKIVTFIHDYTYAFGKQYLKNMYNLTDQIVYSVSFMQEKNIQDYPFDLNKTSIIPQGLYKNEILNSDLKQLRKKLRKKINIPDDAFVVLGVGFIHPRKGIDIFIETAIQTISLADKNDVHFVWLGGELRSNSPDMYIRFLARDIINSNYEHKIHFISLVDDVASYYAIADLFFLSSREDPFPTVVLEALAAGVPVIGIEGSSGSIEIIKKSNNFTIPYRERGKIPILILKLLNNRNLLQDASKKGKEMVISEFNFDDYVVNIKHLLIKKLNIDRNIFKRL